MAELALNNNALMGATILSLQSTQLHCEGAYASWNRDKILIDVLGKGRYHWNTDTTTCLPDCIFLGFSNDNNKKLLFSDLCEVTSQWS